MFATIRNLSSFASLVTLVACSSDPTHLSPDAPAGPTIQLTGTADIVAANQSLTALGGATLAPYTVSGQSAGPATTSSTTLGAFTLTLASPFNGYIKGTATGYVDTYAWPPGMVDADITGATIELISEGTVADLYGANYCAVPGGQNAAEGFVALRVIAFSGTTPMPVANARVTTSSSPADQRICYTASDGGSEKPSAAATETDASGTVLILNAAVGSLTVTATAPGHMFAPTVLSPVAKTYTTTFIAGM